ncbi:MAG: hypothetical protein BWY72_02520 [Bacteroidetes bacterium ADurb.Bin416]|nr:MAG: hypothetical protein BWY72_02520 [Bacteroidetes bacterium ADurb.Bin416]
MYLGTMYQPGLSMAVSTYVYWRHISASFNPFMTFIMLSWML